MSKLTLKAKYERILQAKSSGTHYSKAISSSYTYVFVTKLSNLKHPAMIPVEYKEALQNASRPGSGYLPPERIRGPRGPRPSLAARLVASMSAFADRIEKSALASRLESLSSTIHGKIFIVVFGVLPACYIAFGVMRCVCVIVFHAKLVRIHWIDFWWVWGVSLFT